MKYSDIYRHLEETFEYDSVDMDDWVPEDEEEYADGDFTLDVDDAIKQSHFNTSNIMTDDTTVVDLIQNAKIIKTATWGEMKSWINDQWELMRGNYTVAHKGAVITDFNVSRE